MTLESDRILSLDRYRNRRHLDDRGKGEDNYTLTSNIKNLNIYLKYHNIRFNLKFIQQTVGERVPLSLLPIPPQFASLNLGFVRGHDNESSV
jgi:hypothetical protein